jgi:hypothetical protein
MNKKKLHHYWTKIRAVSYWYFLIAFIVSGLVFVFAYRHNNLEMIRLRDAVFVADEQNGDVEKALQELRKYVHGHMHTQLAVGETAIRPPVQLKYRYERLLAAEKDRVSKANASIYTAAQAECERRFPAGLSGSGRIPCIQEYVASHGTKEQPIPKELYQFDFVSPVWSPDLAGWSLVITILFGFLFVVRFSLELWLRRVLQEHS